MILALWRRFARHFHTDPASPSLLPRRRTRRLAEVDRRDALQYADMDTKCGELRELRHRVAAG